MAVKIPLYNQQSTAEGLIQARAKSEMGVDPMGAALEKFGNAGAHLGGIGMHILKDQQAKLDQKEASDAAIQASNILTDGHQNWSTFVQKSFEGATDGAPDFTKNVMAAYDDWADKTSKSVTNEHGQKLLATGLNSLRTSLFDRSLRMEAEAGVKFRANSIDKIADTNAKMVFSGEMPLDLAVNNVQTAIANANFDPVTRLAMAEKYRELLGNSHLQGQIEKDPTAAKSALTHAYDGGFSRAVEFTLKQEGGYVANDAEKGPTNFGINQTANPGVDVKNLTKQQATAIYRDKYWNAIGGDELAQKNPALATAVFDTAVNSGPETAKKLLAKSGGDTSKFIDLRQEYLNGLVAKNPEKYGKYQDAWNKRVGELRQIANAPTDPSTKLAIDLIPAEKLGGYINAATAEANRQQATYRAQLGSTESDHLAAFANGQTVTNPMTQGQFVKAYGDVEGNTRYMNYQANMQLGADVQTVKTMPITQQADFLESKKPSPDQPGYDLAVKRYDMLASSIDTMNKARATDPIGYAMQLKIGDVQPLQMDKPADLGKQLAGRIGVAQTMNSQYGTPYTLLSKSEASTLSAGLNKMTPEGKLAYIQSIQQNVADTNSYMTVMQQIAGDSPVTAMAGVLANKQSRAVINSGETLKSGDVAATILRGEAILNPTTADKKQDGAGGKFAMPEDKKFLATFTNITGEAYADRPEAAKMAYQAVRAYYAGASAKAGDFSGEENTDRMEQAVKAVTGGISDYNGNGKVVMPWGMDETSFNTKIDAAFKQKMPSLGFSSDIDYGLMNAGDGIYIVKNGTSALRDKTGKLITLDISGNGYGARPDGTLKGSGYFGELKLPNGKVATEYSMQSDAVKVDGKRIDFPTLVPTLSQNQFNQMVNDIIPNEKPVPDDIAQKAVDFAKFRLSQGKNVFAQDGEAQSPMTTPIEKSSKLTNNKLRDK